MLSASVLYKLQFLSQLLVGEGMFLLRLERKTNFIWRGVLCMTALFLTVLILPAQTSGVVDASGQYLILFACTLCALRVCFAEPFQNLLLCGIMGYTVQHLSYLAFTVVNDVWLYDAGALGLPMIDPYSPTPQPTGGMNATQTMLYVGIHVVFYTAIFFIIYVAAFDCFDPLIQANHDFRLGRTSLAWLALLLIAADVISNMVTSHYTPARSVSWGLEIGYNILICLLILALAYHQLSGLALRDELTAVRYMVDQGQRQYELSRKNAELLNIKYHDLRHRSERRGRDTLDAEEQEELKRVLSDYEIQVETGNEPLNVILTEMNAMCRERKIQLLCMADGEGLDFIKPHHLYALFTNAIENAAEAVGSLPEPERVVSLYLRRQGGLFHLQIENPCAEQVTLRDGLPVTRKEDKGYHGFGILSMKTVAEQYGGSLSVRVEDDTFCLDVILPSGRQAAN